MWSIAAKMTGYPPPPSSRRRYLQTSLSLSNEDLKSRLLPYVTTSLRSRVSHHSRRVRVTELLGPQLAVHLHLYTLGHRSTATTIRGDVKGREKPVWRFRHTSIAYSNIIHDNFLRLTWVSRMFPMNAFTL